MLKLEHLNFLIELCDTKGISVPINAARLAAETYETLKTLKAGLEEIKKDEK